MPLRAERRGGGLALSMCNFGTTWEWVDSTTSQPLYSLEASRYPLSKRLNGPQDRSWRERWTANLLHPLGFEHRTVQLAASRYPRSKVVIVRDNDHKWSSGDVSNDTNITTYISIKNIQFTGESCLCTNESRKFSVTRLLWSKGER